MTFTVDRVADISVEEFQQKYAARNLPVIISGGVEPWPARTKWDLDYFATAFPAKVLLFSEKQWNLANFVEQLRSGGQPAPYLNQVKLDEQFQELYADIGELKYTRNNLLNSRLVPNSMRIHRGIKALFIGSAGSGFGKLHWDFSYLHVYISQLRGDKDFLLYAPTDSPHLYPKPSYPNDSIIKDFNNFDVNEFPNVRKATPIRFTVNEGETLFIPGGWWHATKMRGVSISLAESALDKFNWRQRYEWYLDTYRAHGVPFAKRALLRSYMRAVESVVL